MDNNRKKYILNKVKSTLELVSINGINIANICFVNYGANFLIKNDYPSSSTNLCRIFLTAGILSINFAYTNCKIHENTLHYKNRK